MGCYAPPTRGETMFAMYSNELATTAVEAVCYFCTAVGVVLSYLLTLRG
jgi:hypothetical protein